MGADLQDKEVSNSNISKYEILEDSPFVLIEKNDKWVIVMGKHQVSNISFDSINEAKRYIDSKPYELIYVGAYTYGLLMEETINSNNDNKK